MSLEDSLRALSEGYLQKLPGKMREISELWAQLRVEPDVARGREFYRLIHSLVGSGATYGFAELSDAARQVELLAKRWLEAPRQVLPSAEIDAALAALERVIAGIARAASP